MYSFVYISFYKLSSNVLKFVKIVIWHSWKKKKDLIIHVVLVFMTYMSCGRPVPCPGHMREESGTMTCPQPQQG